MHESSDPTYELIRLAVERIASHPSDEQRYLELMFAVDRAVARGLRYADLASFFRDQPDGRGSTWPWLLAQGLTVNLVGRTTEAGSLLKSALDGMRQAGCGESAVAAHALGELSRVDYHLGRLARGMERATLALQVARAAGALVAEGYSHHYLGLLALRRHEYDFSRRHILAARTRFEELGQKTGLARVLDSSAALELECGDHEQARKLLEESLKIKETLGDLRGQALGCGSLARLHHSLGDFSSAMHYLDLEEVLTERVGDERTANHVRLQRGQLLLGHGDIDQAVTQLRSARDMARGRGDVLLAAMSSFELAEALRAAGCRDEAIAEAEAARAFFHDKDDEVMRHRSALRCALISELPMHSPEVRQPLTELRESAEGASLALALWETATAYRKSGQETAVATLYAEALDAADPVLAGQLAAEMRARADTVEGRAWVEAMMSVKLQKDQLEAAYTRLRRSEKLRDSLAQMIVHDLKNPLAAIGPWLETIRMRDLDEETRDQILQTVIDECDYLLRMINDLNEVGRFHAGNKLELAREPLDLPAMLQDVARRLSNRAAAAGLEIKIRQAPDLLPVRGDAGKLRRVIENLVGNAIKYGRPARSSGRPPEIILSLAPEPRRPDDAGPAMRLEVRDHGDGIAPAESERIFEAYYQAEAGRQRKAGVGLGLAYCRLFIEAHGGAIWTQPNPGGGAIFAFRLPAEEPPPAKEPEG